MLGVKVIAGKTNLNQKYFSAKLFSMKEEENNKVNVSAI